MRITEQTLIERKTRLVHVAFSLFCEDGIDSVTLVQIAKASEISLNAIYHYFDSKATLVRHTQKILWEEIVSEVLSEGEELLSAAKNGWEEISILLYSFNKLYKEHSQYLLFACDYKLFLVRNHLKLSEEAYGEIMEPVIKTFKGALVRGRNDGSISCKESVEDQFFAIWGVARGYVEQIVVYDKMYDCANPWKERFDIVLKCVLEYLKNEEKP